MAHGRRGTRRHAQPRARRRTAVAAATTRRPAAAPHRPTERRTADGARATVTGGGRRRRARPSRRRRRASSTSSEPSRGGAGRAEDGEPSRGGCGRRRSKQAREQQHPQRPGDDAAERPRRGGARGASPLILGATNAPSGLSARRALRQHATAASFTKHTATLCVRPLRRRARRRRVAPVLPADVRPSPHHGPVARPLRRAWSATTARPPRPIKQQPIACWWPVSRL